MAFGIDSFKGALSLGGARPNLFEVTIQGSHNITELQFFAKAAQVPASVVGQIDVPYFGRQVKVSGDRTFENWTITVINEEHMNQHKEFEKWLHDLNSYEPNLRTSPTLTDYKAVATVIHYDKYGEKNREYKLQGAFPVNLGALELAWDSNDQVEEFTVELAYDYYTTDDNG